MVRIYESVAKRLGVLLAGARIARTPLGDIYRSLLGGPLDDLTSRALNEVSDTPIDDWDPDEAQREMLDAIVTSRAGFSDGEIIDLLAERVGGSYLRSRFGREDCKAFRRVLMDVRAIPALRTKELSCARCGERMAVGSLATIVDEGASAGHGIWCSRCVHPSSIRCSIDGCERHLDMPQRVMQILKAKEYLCSTHAEERTRKLTSTDGINAPPQPAGLGQAWVAPDFGLDDRIEIHPIDEEGPPQFIPPRAGGLADALRRTPANFIPGRRPR